MGTLHEGRHPGEFVMTEANGSRSRESLVIAASQAVEANSILCRQAAPDKISANASVDAENAGDATIEVGDPAITDEVKAGRYVGVATDATHVAWEDPDGRQIGTSVHGEPFSNEISFTVTAGSTPTEANDEFAVDVVASPGGFQHVAFDPDSNDPIAGITIYPAKTGAGETTKVAAIVRDAEASRDFGRYHRRHLGSARRHRNCHPLYQSGGIVAAAADYRPLPDYHRTSGGEADQAASMGRKEATAALGRKKERRKIR